MEFRRSGQLDERRRRVLMEEVAAPSDGELQPAPSPGKRTPVRAYGDTVLAERQPRISDLVPLRPFALLVLVLMMLTGVAAIEVLYIYWQTIPAAVSNSQELLVDTADLAPIDLLSRGNLAAWYSALLLACGACGSLVIFSIRCHRVDDYRGRYRVWLWTAAALLWSSLDSVTGVHNLLGAALGSAAARTELKDLAWLILYLLVFGALAVRLGIETWHAVGSFATLSVAALMYIVTGMAAIGWIPLPGYLLATVLLSTLVMVSHVVLLTGLMLYARHVHLDAQGKLPLRLRTQGARPKRKNRPKPDAGAVDQEREVDSEKRPVNKTAPASPIAARPGPLASRMSPPVSSEDDDGAELDEVDGDERLSKSERRRLKKLMRQQRRAA